MALLYSREMLIEPNALLLALQSIFPDFGGEELFEDIRAGEASLHTIMIAFASWFDAKAAKPSQLSGLAALIGHCVSIPNHLENAVATCLLEHLHQIDKQGILGKFLSLDVVTYLRRRN